jgi:hypothetical protein
LEATVKDRRRSRAVAIGWTSILFLVSIACAQDATSPAPAGVPQDWSERHILFTARGLLKHPELLSREPRIAHQVVQRLQTSAAPVLNGSSAALVFAPKRDWNVALGAGHVPINMFPAKYSLNPSAPPSCPNDYVVFGLNVVGVTGGRVNLAAFNNLYSGTGGLCGTGAPTVLFAYNVSTDSNGKVLTSPVLSLDGKKIAFVESGTAISIFHVLSWATGAGNGAIANAAVPGVGNTASMTSLTFDAAATSTRSSPWIDYDSDTAYLGVDSGKIYKITGVFKGTPALAGAPWPITLSTNFRLTPPVLDNNLGLLMVGSQNGTLYSINIKTGAVKSLVVGRSGSTDPGILAAPIVDVTDGTTFVVSSNDGTSGVLVQADTNTMTQLAKARIGLASKSGTAINIYEPAFNNTYFVTPATGHLRLCGTGAADVTPWEYEFGFVSQAGRIVMNTTPIFSRQLLPSTTAICTGWTEFFNPNVGSTGTDFFFFGLTAECTGTGTFGCVVARTDVLNTLTTATVDGGPSGIVVDNSSTAGQASSIYLTAEKGANTAYKFTQNGLQ